MLLVAPLLPSSRHREIFPRPVNRRGAVETLNSPRDSVVVLAGYNTLLAVLGFSHLSLRAGGFFLS